MKRTFKPGDRVAYNVPFLRSTGNTTGIWPQLRGTVISTSAFDEVQLCTISWTLNGAPYPMSSRYYNDGFGRVIAPNLTLVEQIGIGSALAT